MNKAICYSGFVALILSGVPELSFAADNHDVGDSDFGIYATVSVHKKIAKRWGIEFETELRSRDNASVLGRFSADLSVDYKITSWLKADVGYAFIYNYFDKTKFNENGNATKIARFWGDRHRPYVALTGDVSFGDFSISLRERYQYTYRSQQTATRYDAVDNEFERKTYDHKHTHSLRTRLELDYMFKSTGMDPHIGAELYYWDSLQKSKYSAGVAWKITKNHTADIYYQYEWNHEGSDPDMHVIGLEYKFKF